MITINEWSVKFNEIYPDYNGFKTDILDNLPETIEDYQVEGKDALKEIYRRLMYRYGTLEIRYMTDGEFKQELMLILEEELVPYIERLRYYKQLLKLNTSQLSVISETISNNSDYTTTPTNVREAQDSYSTQNAVFTKINELQALNLKYQSIISKGINEFLDKFRRLFRNIYMVH